MTDFHVMAGASGDLPRLRVNRLSFEDLWTALARGLDDFRAKPSHYVFLCVVYPLIGVFLIGWSTGANLVQLAFPLMSGFALVGPFAAIGLYEISRRRELGMDTSWRYAFDVRHSPALPSIAAVGAMLVAIFVVWLLVAQGLYTALFGPAAPASLPAFLSQVLTTSPGRALIVYGNLIGLAFAIVALATTVVAFPLLIDRDVGAVAAVETSVRVVAANPLVMLGWGVIVAALLVAGSIPLFAGLAVVMPILGHSTWHLYRRAVADG